MTPESLDIVFSGPGQVELRSRSVAPPGPRELLCAAEWSLLSTGTESFCLAGEFDEGTFWKEWVQYPFTPGYSMSSRILAVGSEAGGFSIGDRIATQTPHASRFAVDQAEAVPIPDDMSSPQAAWMSLACTTQLGVRRAGLELGETAGVIGAGLLGQLVVQYLRLCGAESVIVVDTSADRLELALRSGATEVVNSSVAEAGEELASLTGGRMLDAVFDVTGHHSVLAFASSLLRPLGRLVLLGDSPTPSRQNLGPRIVADSISVLGVHASSAPAQSGHGDRWSLAEMSRLFFEFLRSGRMDVDGLVSHRVSPRDAPELYAALQRDRSPYLGILFDWTEFTT